MSPLTPWADGTPAQAAKPTFWKPAFWVTTAVTLGADAAAFLALPGWDGSGWFLSGTDMFVLFTVLLAFVWAFGLGLILAGLMFLDWLRLRRLRARSSGR